MNPKKVTCGQVFVSTIRTTEENITVLNKVMLLMKFQIKGSTCRYCAAKLNLIHDLGNLVSCGKFLEFRTDLQDFGDLKLAICDRCGLVQLQHNFNQTLLYNENYGYNSALNNSMVLHLSNIADECVGLVKHLDLDLINHLDIGSNDATLINLTKTSFKKAGMSAVNQLGIDPSAVNHQENYKDSKLLLELFSYELSVSLMQKFHLITSIAMLYDLPNPLNFFLGIKNILDQHGVWITEQSYLFSMIEQNAFDTICHEHLEYYSLQNINDLCKSAGLEIIDVDFNTVNGGSFKVYIQHENGKRYSNLSKIKMILASEERRDKELELKEMFNRIKDLKMKMLSFLSDCKDKGREVHGYGASTKGNSLLQYYGITDSEISYIAEINESKFGKFTPGSKIPIVSEQESKSMKPYAYIVLPWHFSSSILEKEFDFMTVTKTRFCFPLPEWKEIGY